MHGRRMAEGHQLIHDLAEHRGRTDQIADHPLHHRSLIGKNQVLHFVERIVEPCELLMRPRIREHMQPDAEPENIVGMIQSRFQQAFLQSFRKLAVFLADKLILICFSLQPRQEMERDPDFAVTFPCDISPDVLAGITHIHPCLDILLFLLIRKWIRVEIIVHELRAMRNQARIRAAKLRPSGKYIHCIKMKIQIHPNTSPVVPRKTLHEPTRSFLNLK